MADLFVVGRVTDDFELKTSARQNPYVRFSVAENIGRGQYARTQYYQVFASGEKALQLVRAKLRKGSFIRVSGALELEEFQKRDGVTRDKRLKVSLYAWEFIHSGKTKATDALPPVEQERPLAVPEIDGERETLPD